MTDKDVPPPEVVDFNQQRDRLRPATLEQAITSLTANNCDRHRPYLGTQPKRAAMKIEGLTRRDICDCMVLGILDSKPPAKHAELLRIYVAANGQKFKDFEALVQSGQAYSSSHLDPERITYNDLYDFDLDTIDPIAAVQNMALYLERLMGVYPALLDGELTRTSEGGDSTA